MHLRRAKCIAQNQSHGNPWGGPALTRFSPPCTAGSLTEARRLSYGNDTATLIRQRGLASSCTSGSPPNVCRSGLLSSPSSCRMAVSAAHMTCKRLAEAGLTLLHRATHTPVAQADVRRAPRTHGAQARRENPCQARSSRPTGAQPALPAPQLPPAPGGTLRP